MTKRASPFVNWILLRDAVAAATARTPELRASVRRFCRAIDARTRLANDLVESSPAIALGLYRDAAAMAGATLSAQRQGKPAGEVMASTIWDVLDEMGPEHVAPAWLRSADLMELERQGALSESQAPAEAAAYVARLRAKLAPRSPVELRVLGWGRAMVFATAALALPTWGIAKALAPRNIAAGRLVTVSSQHPGTPPPSAATNGELESNYGVHTAVELQPWVQVDLGAVRRLARARVYGRGDRYQSESAPVELELSQDGTTWTSAALCLSPFSRSAPWVVALDGQAARFVRLHRPDRGYIAITELELFEAR